MPASLEDRPMAEPTYDSPEQALERTDAFYADEGGFRYSLEKVTEWLRRHVRLPQAGRVLDLCCGDGIWSKGIGDLNPALDLYGIDLSQGAVAKARRLLEADAAHFVVGDAEGDLPFPDGFFALVFARGPGLYNQHSMERPAAIRILEGWHRKLAPGGEFCSVFHSTPERMGTYTPMDQVKLPYNRSPRRTEAVDFRGGKYHHTTDSFLAPFRRARGVEIARYAFVASTHILVTRRRDVPAAGGDFACPRRPGPR
jgi:SAM-dependent methyltransferase